MTDATVSLRSRRSFWALIIAMISCVLVGAFILLWFKLPTWDPEWVVDHSPWADPIVRAVEFTDDEVRERAVQRLIGMGDAAVPPLLGIITHEDTTVRQVAADVFAQVTDDRIVAPVIAHLLTTKEPTSREIAIDPDVDWTPAIHHQHPAVVADHLLPHLKPGPWIPFPLVDLAGRTDDERLVPVLAQLMEQAWEAKEFDQYRRLFYPTMRSAQALVISPCSSAIPHLVRSFGHPDAVIRLRVMEGILFALWMDGSLDLDPRLQRILLAALSDPDAQVRMRAATSMSRTRIAGAEQLLIAMTRSAEMPDRLAALEGLSATWFSPEARRRTVECLKDPDPVVVGRVIDLVKEYDPPPISELLELLASPNEDVRASASSALGRKDYGTDPRVFPALIRSMNDPDALVRFRAKQAAAEVALTPEQQAALAEAVRLAEAK